MLCRLSCKEWIWVTACLLAKSPDMSMQSKGLIFTAPFVCHFLCTGSKIIWHIFAIIHVLLSICFWWATFCNLGCQLHLLYVTWPSCFHLAHLFYLVILKMLSNSISGIPSSAEQSSGTTKNLWYIYLYVLFLLYTCLAILCFIGCMFLTLSFYFCGV